MSENLLHNTTTNTTTNSATYTIPAYSLSNGGAQVLIVIGQENKRPPEGNDERTNRSQKINSPIIFTCKNVHICYFSGQVKRVVK